MAEQTEYIFEDWYWEDYRHALEDWDFLGEVDYRHTIEDWDFPIFVDYRYLLEDW